MRLRAEVVVGGLMLASCTTMPDGARPREASPRFEPRPNIVDGAAKVGRPYAVAGVTYVPFDDRNFDEIGIASWYGQELAGARTASGEVFDPEAMTAAHRTLPLPSYVEVTALESGRTILVRINDRGPFTRDRLIDLSFGAAQKLGLTGRGSAKVRVRRVEPSEDERYALRDARLVDRRQARRRDDMGDDTDDRQIGSGGWYVQVASFSSEARADNLAASLDGIVTSVPGAFRVRLGPYLTNDHARAALESLARSGYPDAIITR